jgi:hypothetical protein
MKRATTFAAGLIAALAVAALFCPGLGSARAQAGCKSFEAIAQASLPTSTRLAATDRWGGPLYASLEGEDEPVRRREHVAAAGAAARQHLLNEVAAV